VESLTGMKPKLSANIGIPVENITGKWMKILIKRS
jgi:hypothetical protein